MITFLLDDPAQIQLAGKEIQFAYHSARHQSSQNSHATRGNVSFVVILWKCSEIKFLGNLSRNRPRYREIIKHPLLQFCYFADRLLKPKLWQDAITDVFSRPHRCFAWLRQIRQFILRSRQFILRSILKCQWTLYRNWTKKKKILLRSAWFGPAVFWL